MVSVLIVDDDQALCQAIAEILAKAGYETRMVHDGREALKSLKDKPADIVVTDLYMPEFDGLELIRKLRRVSPSPCIVAMSAFESDGAADYLKAAKSFGAASVLKKPFRSAELLNAVAACSPEDI